MRCLRGRLSRARAVIAVAALGAAMCAPGASGSAIASTDSTTPAVATSGGTREMADTTILLGV